MIFVVAVPDCLQDGGQDPDPADQWECEKIVYFAYDIKIGCHNSKETSKIRRP